MQQISQNEQHDDEKQRQKTDNPIHIHEFVSRKLFQIADCYQVGAAAQGRAEAAETCAPDDGQQNRCCYGIICNLLLP